MSLWNMEWRGDARNNKMRRSVVWCGEIWFDALC